MYDVLRFLPNGSVEHVEKLTESREPRAESGLGQRRVASGLTTLKFVQHLTYAERRGLAWAFEGYSADSAYFGLLILPYKSLT